MRIRVDFTWYRDAYDYDNVTSFVLLTDVKKSKKAVNQAIRDYAKSWAKAGYILVSSVTTTYNDDKEYCNIAQKKFNFSN